MKKIMLFVCCLLNFNVFCMEQDFSPEEKYKAQVQISLLRREVLPKLAEIYSKTKNGEIKGTNPYLSQHIREKFSLFLKTIMFSMNNIELLETYQILEQYHCTDIPVSLCSWRNSSDGRNYLTFDEYLFSLIKNDPADEKNIFILQMLKPTVCLAAFLNSEEAIKIFIEILYPDLPLEETEKIVSLAICCNYESTKIFWRYFVIEKGYQITEEQFSELWRNNFRDSEIIRIYAERGGVIPFNASTEVTHILSECN